MLAISEPSSVTIAIRSPGCILLTKCAGHVFDPPQLLDRQRHVVQHQHREAAAARIRARRDDGERLDRHAEVADPDLDLGRA